MTKNFKNRCSDKTCAQTLVAALLTIAKGGDNPSDDRVGKVEYYAATERNGVLIHATT